MTTPQVHLIMFGLGLLAYFLITGFRSSPKAMSRQHRRRWWFGAIAAVVVIVSPLTRHFLVPVNGMVLLYQSLLFSAFSLLGLLLFALSLTPFRAMRRVFKKQRRRDGYVAVGNNSNLNSIAQDANSSIQASKSPVTTYGTRTTEKSRAETIRTETINESRQFRNETKPAYVEANVHEGVRENVRKNIDQANTKKLAATNIESVVSLPGKTDAARQLDERLSRSSAANDKISTTENQNEGSLGNHNCATPTTDDEHQIDDTLRLDELVDDTLRLDELADDTLRLDELLPNGEMPANSELSANDNQVTRDQQNPVNEQRTRDKLQADDALPAEDILRAEDALLAEDELDIASIPSVEDSFDLTDTEHLFSAIRSQQTSVELPDEIELQDARQESALQEVYLDTSLLTGLNSDTSHTQTSDIRTADIEEADVIHNDVYLGGEEADLEFGNDLTGEYAHPTDDHKLTHEQVNGHAAEQAQVPEPAPVAEQIQAQTAEQIPEHVTVAEHHNAQALAEPNSLAEALDAAKLTAQSVELQVSNLEKSIAKLDGLRIASIESANSSVEQQNVAMERTNVLLTCEDEARRAAESVIAAQKALLTRAKKQRSKAVALLRQERKHMGLLKGEVERSRKMARTAALLARKAAVAQQEIRSVAKREQTARLKSEESTRKAVNIARNAINALAEEERKRELAQH